MGNEEHDHMLPARYAGVIGAVPNSFTSAIRALMIDIGKGESTPSRSSQFQLKRLIKGPTFLSLFYYITKGLYGAQLSKTNARDHNELFKFHDPLSIATIVAIVYLYKRAKRLCSSDEWKFLDEPLQRDFEVGGQIGLAVPDIGPAYGMLVGIMPYVAFSTFHSHDRKGFTEYRRLITKEGVRCAPELEEKRWGCNAIDVASNILILCGFGPAFVEPFREGWSATQTNNWSSEDTRWRPYAAHQWLSSIVFHEKAPEQLPDRLLNIDKNDLAAAIVLGNQGEELNILSRTKDDVGPELTPELFLDQSSSNGAANSSNNSSYGDLPDDLKQSLSEEEYDQIKHLSIEEIRQLCSD